jgi:peroxiredoxin
MKKAPSGKSNQVQKKAHVRNHTGIIPGAPLHKRSVVFKDVYEVVGSSILGNGKQRVYATANGVFTPDYTVPRLPQYKTFD